MWVTIHFKPGIVQDDTALVSEGTFSDGDKIRFRRGYAQPIGGWETGSVDTFENPIRGAHAWAALTGDKVAGFGSASNLYSLFGGTITDITPLKAKGTLTNAFSATSGSPELIVTDIDHGLQEGDTVTFSYAENTVGGLTIDGDYTVERVLTIDQYVIDGGSNASSTATGGGNVEFEAPWAAGRVDGLGGTGYGTGAYGTGVYGQRDEVSPMVWSVDNWGQNGVFVPRNGPLFEWQPLREYEELLRNGTFSGSETYWSLGTGFSYSSNAITATAGNLSAMVQDVTGVMSGGLVYEWSADITRSAGSIQFRIESSDGAIGQVTLGEAIAKTGTFVRRFRCPPSPQYAGLVKDASFAGTIDNVSIKVVSEAYRIGSAPSYSIGGFVDANRIMVLYGTIETDGDYNPLAVRWSAQEDLETWIADTDNLAGEYILAQGSRVVGGLATRGQNLIWTDAALYTMRFMGNSDEVFRFDSAGTGCGLLGKNAAAEHQGMVFWWARNGQFYIYQGGEPKVIPCPVRRAAWSNFAVSQEEKVYAGVNAEFNEVWWFYPDARDGGNECSRYVAFNWADDVWMTGILPRSAWIPAGVHPNPIGFGTDGYLYFHERGTTANGAVMDWSLTTGLFDLDDGDNLMRIHKYVPDFADQVGNIQTSLTFKGFQRGPTVSASEKTITPTTQAVNLRHMGRQCQISWAPGTNFSFARWGMQRFDVEKVNSRR